MSENHLKAHTESEKDTALLPVLEVSEAMKKCKGKGDWKFK